MYVFYCIVRAINNIYNKKIYTIWQNKTIRNIFSYAGAAIIWYVGICMGKRIYHDIVIIYKLETEFYKTGSLNKKQECEFAITVAKCYNN